MGFVAVRFSRIEAQCPSEQILATALRHCKTPPQILHPELPAQADCWISTGPPELKFEGPQLWMPALIDPDLGDTPFRDHLETPFSVVHCNTLNASKMHSDFAALHVGAMMLGSSKFVTGSS